MDKYATAVRETYDILQEHGYTPRYKDERVEDMPITGADWVEFRGTVTPAGYSNGAVLFILDDTSLPEIVADHTMRCPRFDNAMAAVYDRLQRLEEDS